MLRAYMTRQPSLLLTVLIIFLIGTIVSAAAGQDAAPQIRAEIGRLQKSLKDNPVSDPDWTDLASSTHDTLKAADDALASGRLYLCLERLGSAEDYMLGMRSAVDKADVVKNGLPAFEARWGKASLSLTALDQQARNRDWGHSPTAVQALAEAAQGRAIPLLDGGRGFATATGAKEGLFYVGEAEGEAQFAKFAAGLNLPRTGTGLPLRSLLPELQSLQDKVNAAFQPPKSIDLHSRFIALNSTLKLAQELDARQFYAGALYQYLEAVRHYGMLDARPLDATAQAELKPALAAARKQLEGSSADDSIALLFVERAESYVSHPDGSAPSADEWRGAKLILDQVLPAYLAAQKPAGPTQTPSGKTVAITLVRWPYT